MYQDDTNYCRLLDITTSSSRMQDAYTNTCLLLHCCYYVATMLLLLLRRRYREEVFTQQLPLMEMEVAEELPLNTGMEIARELSLNMETKITMEPRRGEEEEGNKLHSYPSLPSNTWSVLAIQLVS